MKHFKALNRIFDEFQAKLVNIWLSAIIKIAKLSQCNITKPPEHNIHEAYWLTDSVGWVPVVCSFLLNALITIHSPGTFDTTPFIFQMCIQSLVFKKEHWELLHTPDMLLFAKQRLRRKFLICSRSDR